MIDFKQNFDSRWNFAQSKCDDAAQVCDWLTFVKMCMCQTLKIGQLNTFNDRLSI